MPFNTGPSDGRILLTTGAFHTPGILGPPEGFGGTYVPGGSDFQVFTSPASSKSRSASLSRASECAAR
jgi:hypothetical protein